MESDLPLGFQWFLGMWTHHFIKELETLAVPFGLSLFGNMEKRFKGVQRLMQALIQKMQDLGPEPKPLALFLRTYVNLALEHDDFQLAPISMHHASCRLLLLSFSSSQTYSLSGYW